MVRSLEVTFMVRLPRHRVHDQDTLLLILCSRLQSVCEIFLALHRDITHVMVLKCSADFFGFFLKYRAGSTVELPFGPVLERAKVSLLLYAGRKN